MILYFNKNGQLLEQLEYGTAPRVGMTTFQLFGYFENIDLDNFGAALIRLKRPDLEGSEYPDLFMTEASFKYDSSIESSNNFSVTGGPNQNGIYRGYVFDFDKITDANGHIVLLDTPGMWEASITLVNTVGGLNVVGLVKFNVERASSSVDDEPTELDYSVITNNIAGALSAKVGKSDGYYARYHTNLIPAAVQGTLLSNVFIVGAYVYDLATDSWYVITSVTPNTSTTVFATLRVTSLNGDLNRTVNVTYAILKHLRDTANLVPGQTYRITDYVCTTAQINTSSAGHQFDIIVTADNENTLNESAKAILHEGDTYFANNNLAAWELKYCLDNDTDRFEWADSVNGKGVIYWLKDEFDNECPYDFKNILYLEGYTFFSAGEGNGDASIGALGAVRNNVIKTTIIQHYDSQQDTYTFNSYKLCCNRITGSNNLIEACANNNLIYGSNNIIGFNSCNNIIGSIGFSPSNYNVLGQNCNNNEILGEHNIFGNDCSSNVLKGTNASTATVSLECSYNIFGNNCISNVLGSELGGICNYNTFKNNCSNNLLMASCSNNVFKNDCTYMTLGPECNYNSFGNNCTNIMLTKPDYIYRTINSRNIFGDNCSYINMYYSNNHNVFKNDCSYIDLGSYCSYNTFQNGCQSITLGTNIDTINYCSNNMFDNGCKYIYLSCTDTSASNSNKLQNIHVHLGVSGSSSANRLSIVVPDRNLSYSTDYYMTDSTEVFL